MCNLVVETTCSSFQSLLRPLTDARLKQLSLFQAVLCGSVRALHILEKCGNILTQKHVNEAAKYGHVEMVRDLRAHNITTSMLPV